MRIDFSVTVRYAESGDTTTGGAPSGTWDWSNRAYSQSWARCLKMLLHQPIRSPPLTQAVRLVDRIRPHPRGVFDWFADSCAIEGEAQHSLVAVNQRDARIAGRRNRRRIDAQLTVGTHEGNVLVPTGHEGLLRA